MRIPNLSTTENITDTIRRMDERRMELEQQVSSGQKITLPEDDGMRMGRLIKMDTEKSTLTQYRRNASYATEYLNAGHLNLDKLREVSVRAQEIARVAGSGLNASAMKTYGFEVDQLIEEALNRVNSSHRKRSLFGGNETTPSFQSSEIQLGKRFQKTLSFFDNYVGSSNPDGKRELSEGDEVWVNANGHEYVLKAKRSGFTTKDAADRLAEAINNDVGDLPDVNKKFDALFPTNEDFEISVRGSRESGLRNNNVKVTASTSEQGDLILVAGVDQDFDASAQHVTKFELQFFFKDSVKKDLEDRIRSLETEFANDPDPKQREIYKGKSFDDLELDVKKKVARDVFVANWPDVQKWKGFDDPVSLGKFDPTAHFPLLSQSTLDLIASSGSNMRLATDADVSLGVSVRVGDYMPSRFLSYSDAADMRLATEADVSLGTSVKVGDHINATQTDVDAGRAVIVGDYFAATSSDVGSRPVAKGDKLSSRFFAQATQTDVNAGRAATVGDYMRDATTLSRNVSLGASVKVGDHIQATLNDVTAGKAAKVGDYFPATQADVDAGTTLNVGDKRINEAGDYVPVRYFDQLAAEDKDKLGSAIFEEGWDRDLSSSASYSTTFGSDYYFPKPTQLKLDAAAASQFNGKTYQELTPTEKEKIAIQVFGGSWERDLSLSGSKVIGTSRATIHHPTDWKRLSAYQYGDLVNFDGKLWRSRMDANWNHKPDGMDPAIWEEVPSQYDVERDDWELTVSGTRTRDYWLSPDGKMYDRQEDAVERTRQIVIQTGYVQSHDELTSEIARLTKRVTYAVPQFSATGSESGDALVSFDAQTQEHFLASPSDGGSVITGTLLQGEFTRDASSSGGLPGKASLEHQAGDVVFSQGRYYSARQAIAETDDRSSWEYLSQWEKDAVSGAYVPPNNLGDHDEDRTLEKGDHIFDAAKSQYYVATAEVKIKAGDDLEQRSELKAVSSGSDGNVQFLGETLPIQGNEKTFSAERPLDILAGEYLHDPENNKYYLATQNFSLEPNLLSGAINVPAAGHGELTLKNGEHVLVTDHVAVQADVDLGLTIKIGDKIDKYYIATSDVTIPAGSDLVASLKVVIPSDTFDPTTFGALESVSASFAEQGADWSPAFEYKKGQIVNYNGQYYQCLQDNWNNLALDPETMSDFVVVPSDESIRQLVQGSGEIKKVANYAWSSLEKPLGHVLKFSIEEEDTATVALPTAGRGGTTAKAKAMVDAYGKVVGMRVLDPGRYFSGVSSKGEMLPPDFDRAEVSFPDGQSVMVDVLWYRDFTDPGTWKVSGFDLGDRAMPGGINSGPQTGDTYSFATGAKTFLEHRDENGFVVDVAYSGSTENSEFYIGHKSKISSFLEAKNKGTEELGDVVSSLVDLREALRNAKPSAYAAEVEAANQQLIALEERVVDKMGDLSAKMVRMETVKSHDEDYYMELNERISRDLDLDLSEAIMRLMRASTSYQASLQVGAQLMNTSLLNYL